MAGTTPARASGVMRGARALRGACCCCWARKPRALKTAKKIGLREVGSAMALLMSAVSDSASHPPGEKAATYTEKPTHPAAIAVRAGKRERVSPMVGSSAATAHGEGERVRGSGGALADGAKAALCGSAQSRLATARVVGHIPAISWERKVASESKLAESSRRV